MWLVTMYPGGHDAYKKPYYTVVDSVESLLELVHVYATDGTKYCVRPIGDVCIVDFS